MLFVGLLLLVVEVCNGLGILDRIVDESHVLILGVHCRSTFIIAFVLRVLQDGSPPRMCPANVVCSNPGEDMQTPVGLGNAKFVHWE